MPMTEGERKAYQRGYCRAATWPDHRPPRPPDPTIRKLMDALRGLRDCADTLCATLEEDDDFVKQFDGPIQKADDALIEVGEWLKSSIPESRQLR